MNLARLNRIQVAQEPDYDPFAEAQAAEESRARRKREALDLARLQRETARAERMEKEDARKREVLGKYIEERDLFGQIPVGVLSPEYVGKQEFGPQMQGREVAPRNLEPFERKTTVDLARINPEYAETFRTGIKTERLSDEARAREIEKEKRSIQSDADKAAFERRKQEEVERHNKADEYIRGLTARKSGKPDYKPLPGQARENIAKLSGQATNLKNVFNLAEKDFFGKSIGGNAIKDVAIWIGAGGASTEWWKRYQKYMNDVIKEFSGAAVTKPEAERLQKAFVTPQTDPIIAAKLMKQAQMDVESGLKKLTGSYNAGGFYNPDEIQALVETYGSEIPVQADPKKKYLRDVLQEYEEMEELKRLEALEKGGR